MNKRGRPRKPVPDSALKVMDELNILTAKIRDLQDEVISLSKKRKQLALEAREMGASTGWIAEACGLKRKSYPIR